MRPAAPKPNTIPATTRIPTTVPIPALILLATLAAACAAPDSPLPPMQSGGQTHVFDLNAETFFLAEVDQISADFTVTVTGPDGETLREVDGRTRGIETFRFETEAAGEYEIAIDAPDDEAGEFRFSVLRSEPVATDPAARLDQMLSPWDGDDRPGVIAAVIEDGEMALVRTYGMANLSHGIPWERGTISNIGSVTKQFTAMGMLLLEAQGRLALDDDIRTHIPELPDFGETVTPRHFLNHTSGYREIYNLMSVGGFGGEDTFSREHAITVVQRQDELQNRPHTEWNYNNTGFILLSLAAERATDHSFADYMRESVFEPLGMHNTRVKMMQGELIPGSAQGYAGVESGGYRTTRDLPASAGAGGIYTTIDDLHQWLGNFADPQLGGPGAIEALTTSAILESGDTTGYGLGLGVGELGGRTLYSHTGGDIAHRTYMGYLPELDGGVILMSNNAGFDLGMGPRVVRLFFADELEPEEDAAAEGEDEEAETEGTMSDERKEAIAGDWVLEVQGMAIPMEVLLEEGTLHVELSGQGRVTAQTTSDSTIALPAVDAAFTFRFDDEGNATEATGTQSGTEMTLRRTDRTELATDDLVAYAGRYYCDELEVFMTVAVEDAGLVLHQLGQESQPLSHVAGDNFSAPVNHLNEIAFERAADGSVTGFRVSNGRTRGVWFGKG